MALKLRHPVLRTVNWVYLVGFVGQAAAAQEPSDSAIYAILARRVEARQAAGIVVGLAQGNRVRFFANGERNEAGTGRLDERTVFEIGSATKAFTGILLAEMAERGEVRLEDPLDRYLPAGITAPARNGKPISLLDLATHTSGLPRMPTNFQPANQENPYADYTSERMYGFLSGYALPRDPGSLYEYSNYGMGLLGTVLARKLQLTYEEALIRRVLLPLRLAETRITLTPKLRSRFAVGHTASLAVQGQWDLDAMAGAGALRSTAKDMVRFLQANLAPEQTGLAGALISAQQPRRNAGNPNTQIGLGWHLLDRPGRQIVWHNGQTGGYHSFIAFDRSTRSAVVVLANSAHDIDDIGLHLLDPGIPLREPRRAVAHQEITVDPAALDRFVGEYQLAPTFSIVVTKENGALWAQATGQQKFPIFPEAPDRFFYKVVDAQLAFRMDSAGRVTGLTLHQNGASVPGRRVP